MKMNSKDTLVRTQIKTQYKLLFIVF